MQHKMFPIVIPPPPEMDYYYDYKVEQFRDFNQQIRDLREYMRENAVKLKQLKEKKRSCPENQ